MLVGMTEKVSDNLNPDFTTKFNVDYYFNGHQSFSVEVYDIDQNGKDFLGKCIFDLGQVIGSKKKPFVVQMISFKNIALASSLYIFWDKAVKSNYLLNFGFQCQNIKDIEFFSKSDPFLKFFRYEVPHKTKNDVTVQEPNWRLAHQTEHYDDNLNPTFKDFHIEDQNLCYGDPNQAIKVEVWDYSRRGKHTWIGSLLFCINDIIRGEKRWSFLDKKNKSAGVLINTSFFSQTNYDFLDYLQGGVILNTMLGIDFTLSNEEPHKPISLHYTGNPEQPNQYQSAMHHIVSIIQNYDIDKMIPVFGFGGMYKGQVSHCFPLSGDEQNPFVFAVEGVMNVYYQAIKQYKLHGPTYFSPLIRRAIHISVSEQNIMSYLILVIFTDGVICDMPETIDAIVEASYCPISIIIVGVGKEDFQKMERLDGDGQLLRT